MHACTHKCTYIDSPTDKRTHAHTRMYRPCTNSLAVFLSTPWRSQVTSPWSCLSVLFRTSIHPSFFFSAIRLIFVLGDCRTPCLLEIVSATSPFSSQIIAVHWLLEGVQVNLAFSPLRTVRFSGNSFIWASTAKTSINKTLSVIYLFILHQVWSRNLSEIIFEISQTKQFSRASLLTTAEVLLKKYLNILGNKLTGCLAESYMRKSIVLKQQAAV